MRAKRVKLTASILLLSLAIFMVGCAEQQRNGGKGGQQGPPPEAFKACEDKAVGEVVQFSGRDGKSITATCKMIANKMVAVPKDHEGSSKRP